MSRSFDPRPSSACHSNHCRSCPRSSPRPLRAGGGDKRGWSSTVETVTGGNRRCWTPAPPSPPSCGRLSARKTGRCSRSGAASPPAWVQPARSRERSPLGIMAEMMMYNHFRLVRSTASERELCFDKPPLPLVHPSLWTRSGVCVLAPTSGNLHSGEPGTQVTDMGLGNGWLWVGTAVGKGHGYALP